MARACGISGTWPNMFLRRSSLLRLQKQKYVSEFWRINAILNVWLIPYPIIIKNLQRFQRKPIFYIQMAGFRRLLYPSMAGQTKIQENALLWHRREFCVQIFGRRSVRLQLGWFGTDQLQTWPGAFPGGWRWNSDHRRRVRERLFKNLFVLLEIENCI